MLPKGDRSPTLSQRPDNVLTAIVDNTQNVGWGFHEELADIYYSYVEGFEEDEDED